MIEPMEGSVKRIGFLKWICARLEKYLCCQPYAEQGTRVKRIKSSVEKLWQNERWCYIISAAFKVL